MIVPNQKVEVVWTANNKDYYENKGYIFTNFRDSFLVNAEDLPKTSDKKINVICDICGISKQVCYSTYINNIKSNTVYVCHRCTIQLRHDKTLNARQEDYFLRLTEKCNENGYTLISNKKDIKNNISIIEYLCPKHGIQSMRLNNFLNGRKCPKCNHDIARAKFKLSKDELLRRVEECNGVLLNPDDYVNNSEENLIFICSMCGETFISSFKNYVQHGGRLCNKCSSKESVGESRVRMFLEKHNIKYEKEKWFTDCRDIRPLPFDFYLPDHNLIIEYDGEQHFSNDNKGFFKHSIEEIRYHDEIKNNYCKENNISLIRIPYNRLQGIERILENKILT